MPRPRAEKPLAARVAAVLGAVKKLERKGHNSNGDYDYTRATDVFKAVRDRLFALGILLLPDEGEPVYVSIPTNGGELLTECRLPVTYTFWESKDSSLPPLRCHGVGRTKDEKALYIAQTGAEKAFLKRIGLMAEKIDDPEWDGRQHSEQYGTGESLDDVAPLKGSKRKREQPIRDFEVAAIENACADTQKKPAEIADVMCARFKVATVPELKRWQFKDALAWASNGAGTLAPKPQAAPALQGSLPLPRPAPSFEMRVGGKSVEVQPKTGSYAL